MIVIDMLSNPKYVIYFRNNNFQWSFLARNESLYINTYIIPVEGTYTNRLTLEKNIESSHKFIVKDVNVSGWYIIFLYLLSKLVWWRFRCEEKLVD